MGAVVRSTRVMAASQLPGDQNDGIVNTGTTTTTAETSDATTTTTTTTASTVEGETIMFDPIRDI
jgi:expansin (peptidoglycan-binding protein)